MKTCNKKISLVYEGTGPIKWLMIDKYDSMLPKILNILFFVAAVGFPLTRPEDICKLSHNKIS